MPTNALPMKTKHSYSYCVLRYVHDAATGEHVNVGVLVLSQDASFVEIRLRDDDTRVRALFPDLDRSAFRDALAAVGRGVAALTANAVERHVYADAGALARAVLPADDSALQWSPAGGGLASNMAATSEHLYRRLITSHDKPPCG
jgi:hypothetical protein